jgi:nitrite reductase/ring-hydroxylating ferredoxin subunit
MAAASTTLAYAAASAAAAVAAAAGYYYCAASRTTFVRVGAVDDFPIGKAREVEVPTAEGRPTQVLVIRESATRFRACGAVCTHANVRLVGGVLGCETSRLVCPAHGACFNTATGDIEDGCVLGCLLSPAPALRLL